MKFKIKTHRNEIKSYKFFVIKPNKLMFKKCLIDVPNAAV